MHQSQAEDQGQFYEKIILESKNWLVRVYVNV